PPSSPDLNLIEPLWLIFKQCVADISGSYNSLDKLWKVAQSVWDGFTEKEIAKFTRIMKERIEALRKAKGKQIGY
ncbi:hypothetical protein C8Q75DRAFT_715714, partial [Abortiporus biennis]